MLLSNRNAKYDKRYTKGICICVDMGVLRLPYVWIYIIFCEKNMDIFEAIQ